MTNNLRRLIVLLPGFATLGVAADPGYYRHPAIHGDTIVFTAEGDLWRVAASGGRAERLTTQPAEESQAAISPDGRWIGFVASYDGTNDVYVMPMAGGAPRRLSVDLGRVSVHGFSSDGQLAFSTDSIVGPGSSRRVRLVDPATGATRELPLAEANDASFDDTGTSVWFGRFGLAVTGDNARDYRGGALAEIWRWTSGSTQEATRLAADANANLSHPMWWDGKVHAISDASGVANLWVMGEDGSGLRQLTQHADFEVRGASLGQGRIVYQHGADLRVYDIKSATDQRIAIDLGSDSLQTRARHVGKPLKHVESVRASLDAERVVLTARGQVVIASVGPRRRVTVPLPVGVRATAAVLSKDQKSVFAILHRDNSSELWRLPSDGSAGGEAITSNGDARRWRAYLAPDGQAIAHDDKRGRLWLDDLASGEQILIDDAVHGGDDPWSQVVWSKDARHLALVRPGSALQRPQVYLFERASRKLVEITSDRYESYAPAFSADGRWLYFLSARNFQDTASSAWSDRNSGPVFDKRVKVYAVGLTADGRFPFLPADELNLPAKPDTDATAAATPVATTVQVDLEGAAKRLYATPVPPGNYEALAVAEKHLYVLDREGIPGAKGQLRSIALDALNPKVELFQADVEGFSLSTDAKKLFFVKSPGDDAPIGAMHSVDVGAKAPDDLARTQLRVDDWQLPVDPRAEWATMFDDAWRMHRQFAFDQRMRGVDWDSVRTKYAPLVARLTDRSELNDLLAQLSAEFGALHTQMRPGDVRNAADAPKVASLAAEYAVVESGLKIVRIYRGDDELPEDRGPLQAPGTDIVLGDILLAVNRQPVRSEADLARLLANQAGQQVLVTVQRGATPPRDAIVLPVNAERNANLRYAQWVRERRAVVSSADVRIGYLHLRAMGGSDMANFMREFYANVNRQGLIIDVRRNRGGSIDSWIIEKLLRRVWSYWQVPGETAITNMQQTFNGHLVVLADQLTYSDGETFTAGVKALDLGTVIGMRTAGAGVWLSDRNALIDGGMARVPEFPQYDLRGRWIIEANGVVPDITVDNLPYATGIGGDAQLDAAIAQVLKRMGEEPKALPASQPIPERRQRAHDFGSSD